MGALASAPAFAAEFYVDAGSRGGRSDDGNPGTATKPWRTLSRALGARAPGPEAGDTVWVRGGIYKERPCVERGGQADKPLTIRAFRGERSVLDGEGTRGGITLASDSGADYVVIDGLSFTNLGQNAAAVSVNGRTGIVLRGLHVAGTGSGIVLSGCRACRVLKCDIPQLSVDTGCSGIVMAENHIHHNARGHALSVYAPGDGVRADGEVVAVEQVAPGLARFRGPDLKLHKARSGALYGQNAAGTVKNPSLVLFFDRRMKQHGPGVWTTDKGIAGGKVPLADGRDWFVLRSNPDWGGKPYSPDGTEGLFETGAARWEDLARAKYAWVAYVFDPGTANRDIRILDNEVDHAAVQGIWVQRADGILIRGNKVHHNGATGIQIETLCRRVWIEGNVSYANNVRSIHETGIWLDETIDAVVQDNVVYENEKGMGITQCEWVLMRRNVFYNNRAQHVPPGKAEQARGNAGGFWFSGGRGCHLGAPPGAAHNAFVHNMLVGNGTDSSRWGGLQHGLSGYPKIGRNHFINNIVHDHRGALVLDAWHTPGVVDGNIYHGARPLRARCGGNGGGQPATYLISEPGGLAAYRAASGLDLHSRVGAVAFVDAKGGNFRPAPGSVAIDAGQPLTRTTAAGSGPDVPVEDVSCFSAGFRTGKGEPVIPGDEIVVAGAAARIVAIDREQAVLKIDRNLTWRQGDPVAYVYVGAGPDAGAFEVH
ncbi:MAG: right-handed parallel beta-helix repeat-containing protein [Kiritimatiellae bacterium]|nr:right-handed parallel beta-helix repeat-containing protein [Kiritimatiellia bacterium]